MVTSTSRLLALLALSIAAAAQTPAPASKSGDTELKFVVYLSRHGVRSPTGDPSRYAKYSRAAWPQWDVPPGYLTAHGFQLMQQFGAYDRSLLAREGLLDTVGCKDADQVWFYADSDQRTRESGRALAAGMFPNCAPLPVHGFPEGTHDPLFHPPHRIAATQTEEPVDDQHSEAAAQRLTEKYRPQLAEMDRILAACGSPASPQQERVSLLDASWSPPAGKHGDPGDLRGPLGTAAGMSENFLLEYTQGMPMRDVGWGCVSRTTLDSLIGLHTAASDYEHRSPAVARMDASGMLSRIRAALAQAVTGQAVPGAPNPPGGRALFLIGHDTNLATVAELLHLHWTADGRRDDTPPGAALVFEVWRSRSSGHDSVRVFYTAQSLDQMRDSSVLTLAHPPLRVPLTVEGCSAAGDQGCSWSSFSQVVDRAIDPADVESPAGEKRTGN